jgi:putative heme-binding domain-containing protein
MNRTHAYDAVPANQIRTLEHIGLFSNTPEKGRRRGGTLVNPYDASETAEARARSYLHVNCSVCHVEAGGGNAKMELGIATALEKMNLIEARPQHDTFGIGNAMLIAPEHPENSVLLQRISRRGQGQMPPLVSKVVDEKAVALFREWISGMAAKQTFVRDWQMSDLLPQLGQTTGMPDIGKNAFQKAGCVQCHRFAGTGGTVGPDLDGVRQRLTSRDILESILLPSKVIAQGYASSEIETTNGDSITGFIEREDNDSIVVRPLSGTDPSVTIRKKEIARRTLSNISNMPAGTVNTLRGVEIADLIAYLISDGKVKPLPTLKTDE